MVVDVRRGNTLAAVCRVEGFRLSEYCQGFNEVESFRSLRHTGYLKLYVKGYNTLIL